MGMELLHISPHDVARFKDQQIQISLERHPWPIIVWQYQVGLLYNTTKIMMAAPILMKQVGTPTIPTFAIVLARLLYRYVDYCCNTVQGSQWEWELTLGIWATVILDLFVWF